MSKKLFVFLLVLMSLSLIGIIFVQAYYIKNSIENEKKQFAFNVKKSISATARKIEEREYRDWVVEIQDLISKSDKVIDSAAIRNLYIKQEGDNANEILFYRNGVLEQDYKLASTIFDIGLDSIPIKRVLSEREIRLVNNANLDAVNSTGLDAMIKMSRGEEILYDTAYEDLSNRMPIHKRVTVNEIGRLLSRKLQEDNIDIVYQFAIYSNDLATKVQTPDFDIENNTTFSIPIFKSESSLAKYRLLVNFPEHNKYIWSSVIGMILLSVIFTSIIIIAYASALMQLFKQRQISEIKTDFINNMTHEFKTPIATINLALDAIKNPKIIDDKEKVIRYLYMIKEENKRMHAQVENVLRISKLEKNELNISKENLELHDLIEDAITHVSLIVENKSGTIKTSFKAGNSTVLANDMHFTNVLVNILDNAIKYSPEAPKIEVSTVNVGENIILNIKDHGSGMSKAAQKRVFEKFYREHTGNIHNVKGHGLGLAYVKRIVDDHQGHISVESEKDKGSTFIIKLPLIS
ncbi:MAG: sensor histidine kinase [Oceanihabitans sp.]